MRDLCDWSLETPVMHTFRISRSKLQLSFHVARVWDLDAVNPSVSPKEDGTVTALIRMIFLGLTVL